MVRQVLEFDLPDRFVAGTVGQPGSRAFFLQARQGTRLTSVALEKAQVSVLAERIDELLDEVLRRTGGTAGVPALATADSDDDAPLQTPVEEEFRVGTMSLAWDGDTERIVVECFADDTPAADELDDLDELDDEHATGTVLRVSLTGAAARAFAKRAIAVVAAGRPPCPFCSGPLDPEGHICPRANGYRR
ncbi:MAG: hypothetical protein QG622_150 [Actinomycetota bacterium]|nr:hypothetical protein [Actinomycetota bacterium]